MNVYCKGHMDLKFKIAWKQETENWELAWFNKRYIYYTHTVYIATLFYADDI